MRNALVIVAVLAMLVLAGCAPKAPAVEAAPPTATEQEVTDVSGDVEGLEDLSEDLGLDELESLDQELADIEALELQ